MTDLTQRAAALLAAAKRADPNMSGWQSYDCFLGTAPENRAWVSCAPGVAALIREFLTENERLRMCLYDEQDGITGTLRKDEIERLRARVAELESMAGLSSREVDRLTALILKAHAEDERMNAIAQNGNDGLHYREVGPTPLRGRVTRRDE